MAKWVCFHHNLVLDKPSCEFCNFNRDCYPPVPISSKVAIEKIKSKIKEYNDILNELGNDKVIFMEDARNEEKK